MKIKNITLLSAITLALTGCNIGEGEDIASNTASSTDNTSTSTYQAPTGNGSSKAYITYQDKDVYLNGGNVAWLSFAKDFGTGLDETKTNQMLDQIKLSGGNSVRWWVHTNGTQTPAWSADKLTVASATEQQQAITDIKKALDIAGEKDMYIMLSLWSFDMLAVKQKGVTDVVDANYKFLTEQSMRESYINNFLNPLLDEIAGHKALIGIDLFNEPENMTESWFRDREGLGTNYQVTLEDIHTTTAILSAAIHDKADELDKEVLVTTGPKSLGMFNTDGFGGTNYYSDANMTNYGGTNAPLDYYSPHYYDDMGKNGEWSPFYRAASYWELDKPVVIAEFFADADAYKKASFDYFGNKVGEEQLCVRLSDNQYAGGFVWQWTNQYSQSVLKCINALSVAQGGDDLKDSSSAGNYTMEDGNVPLGISVNSETGGTVNLSVTDAESHDSTKALQATITESAAEKKVYLLLPISDTPATSVSLWVKIPQETADAGFTGGKMFAKDGNWSWSEGDWVNINPGEWTAVSWTPDSPFGDVKEIGFQLYANKDGATITDGVVYFDDIKFTSAD